MNALLDKKIIRSTSDVENYLKFVEENRLLANQLVNENTRGELGQFMTPLPVAKIMSGMFDNLNGNISLLDAGAGVGSLSASLIAEACSRKTTPESINLTAFEVEPLFIDYLKINLEAAKALCEKFNIKLNYSIINDDFIKSSVDRIKLKLFNNNFTLYNAAILNPPYRKINSNSKNRKLLRSIGIETSNMYSAFVALSILLLEKNSELVAITPRSFCNGPYFKPFRELLFSEMVLKEIYIFEKRNKAFKGDNVLQENIIYHLIKSKIRTTVLVSAGDCEKTKANSRKEVPHEKVVSQKDPNLIIHIATSHNDSDIQKKALSLKKTLSDIQLQVSTGRVVDFRAKEHLKKIYNKENMVPLIYPLNFDKGSIVWPKQKGGKPIALSLCEETEKLLVPKGTYVLVKRFSSKEERRRIVASIFDSDKIESDKIGFENHLNYFHMNGIGMRKDIAVGLMLFLNSSIIDNYFRQFSGHTQVNATDLKNLRYPSINQLEKLSEEYTGELPDQDEIDRIVDTVLFN